MRTSIFLLRFLHASSIRRLQKSTGTGSCIFNFTASGPALLSKQKSLECARQLQQTINGFPVNSINKGYLDTTILPPGIAAGYLKKRGQKRDYTFSD